MLITVGVISILTCLLHTVLEFEATAIRGSSGSIVHTRYPVALQAVGQAVDQTEAAGTRLAVTTETKNVAILVISGDVLGKVPRRKVGIIGPTAKVSVGQTVQPVVTTKEYILNSINK